LKFKDKKNIQGTIQFPIPTGQFIRNFELLCAITLE